MIIRQADKFELNEARANYDLPAGTKYFAAVHGIKIYFAQSSDGYFHLVWLNESEYTNNFAKLLRTINKAINDLK